VGNRIRLIDLLYSSSVISNLKGVFTHKKGIISFGRLRFGVPRAAGRLEEFGFRGTFLPEAKLPETPSGIKTFFLKAADALLKL